MNDDFKLMINLFLFVILIAFTTYGAIWVTDVTREYQKVVNISIKYHIPDNDRSSFPIQGRNVIFDNNGIIYLISKSDYDKCNVGEKTKISYNTFYLPFMENRDINTIRSIGV